MHADDRRGERLAFATGDKHDGGQGLESATTPMKRTSLLAATLAVSAIVASVFYQTAMTRHS